MNYTRGEYILRQQEELKGLLSEVSIGIEASKTYYDDIENYIKNGNKITLRMYESLSLGQKFHFNKHYNYRGDKII